MAQAPDDVKTSLTSPQRKSVNIRDDNVQIVEVGEKHGPLYNAIPTMPLPVAAVCCVFNILVPGLGKLPCLAFLLLRLLGALCLPRAPKQDSELLPCYCCLPHTHACVLSCSHAASVALQGSRELEECISI